MFPGWWAELNALQFGYMYIYIYIYIDSFLRPFVELIKITDCGHGLLCPIEAKNGTTDKYGNCRKECCRYVDPGCCKWRANSLVRYHFEKWCIVMHSVSPWLYIAATLIKGNAWYLCFPSFSFSRFFFLVFFPISFFFSDSISPSFNFFSPSSSFAFSFFVWVRVGAW